MSTQRNLITLCFAAVFTLGLAACGGGGGGAPVTGMPDTMDTMEPEAHACDADAGPSQACVDARQAELEAIENDSDATEGALNAAEMALGTAQTALADANTAAAAEQLANALAAVADARTMVEALTAASSNSDRAAAYSSLAAAQAALAEASGIPENEIALLKAEIARLQGVIGQAATDAQAEADRIAAEMAVEAARIAALVAGTASAETKEKAIAAEEDGTAAGLGGIADDAVQDPPTKWTLGISRDRVETGIKITDPALTGDDNPKFAQAMDLGNGRTMHVREMEADADGDVVTEVVIVATDIEAPKAVAFAEWRDMALMPPQVLDVMKDGEAPGTGETANALDVVDNDNNMALVTRMMPARSTLDGMHNYSPDNPDGLATDVDEGLHDGTYNGAEGTFRCTEDSTTDCTITFDAKGKVSGASDNWVFIPDMGATSDEPDYDYLNYGFWLKKTADADGAITYDEVQTFAGSSVALSSGTELNDVQGSATYEGGATGVYVHEDGQLGWHSPIRHRRPVLGGCQPDGYLQSGERRLRLGHHRGQLAEHRHRNH